MKPFFLFVLAVLLAAHPNSRPVRGDASPDEVYSLDHVLDVRLEIDASDWDLVRRQYPDVYALTEPTDKETYTYVPGRAVINGKEFGKIAVRKKGFVGSWSSTRPSLKLNFRTYDNLKFAGLRRLTLNNNQQDASNMHQVLVYHMFRKAGIPAPRCGFATVTINGDSKGLYTNVEPIKKPFLKRHFGSGKGNLYEGQRSDFREGWTVTFQKKTNVNSDQADLDRLVEVLALDDDQLVDALSEIVDIDAFIRFWAMECLVGHWDGYAENLNNFYMYNAPDSGKFHFIPWGADSAFGDKNDFLKYEPPVSVRAVGMLARRLYNLPATRDQYRSTLSNLLETVWDETELLELVDRIEAIVQKESPEIAGHGRAVAKIKKFIANRREELTKDLAQPASDWDFPLEEEILIGVGDPKGTFTATFETKWQGGTLINPFANSKVDFTLEWDEEVPEFFVKGASAGPFPEQFRFGYPHLLIGGVTSNGHIFGASVIVDHESFRPGEYDFNLFDVMGVMIDFNLVGGKPKPDLRGFLKGTLRLDKASTDRGEIVSGSIDVEIQ